MGDIRIITVPEGEEKENGAECLFKEMIAENLPILGKQLERHVHEAKRMPNYLNIKRPFIRLIILELLKVSDKKKKKSILKAARSKRIATYKGTILGY